MVRVTSLVTTPELAPTVVALMLVCTLKVYVPGGALAAIVPLIGALATPPPTLVAPTLSPRLASDTPGAPTMDALKPLAAVSLEVIVYRNAWFSLPVAVVPLDIPYTVTGMLCVAAPLGFWTVNPKESAPV